MARRLFSGLLALLSFCTPLLVSTAALADAPGWSFSTAPTARTGNQVLGIVPGSTGSFALFFRCREASGALLPWYSDGTSFTAGTAKSVVWGGCGNDVAGRTSVAFAVTTTAGAVPTWETATLTWTDPAYPAAGLSAPAPTSSPTPTPTPSTSSPPTTSGPACGLTVETACWTRPVPVASSTPAPTGPPAPTLVSLVSGDRLVFVVGLGLCGLFLSALFVSQLRRP